MLPEGGLTLAGKAELGSGGARAQFPQLMGLRFPDLDVELFGGVACSRNLLVGRAQAQFLLVLHALA